MATLIPVRPSAPSRVSFAWVRRTSSRLSVSAGLAAERFRWWLAFVLIALTLVARPAERHVRATAMLLALSGASVSAVQSDFAVESVDIPMEGTSGTGGGAGATVRARIYRPLSSLPSFGMPRGVVLAHGVHHLGIDEPRLIALAKGFAQAGLVVLTPQLEPLSDYRVDDPMNLATLRVSVRYLARRTDRVRRGGVGLMGVSFAGGLALRTASDPNLRGDLAFVASIGGHHDMRRVARYFVTDRVATPEGEIEWKAHDYGLAVLIYNAPEKFVSKEDAPYLRRAVRAFLHENYAEAQQAALALSPSGFSIFDRIYRRDRLALSALVLAALPALEQTMADASPAGHLSSIQVPIFLLHGAHDDVVPPSEASWVAREAGPHTEVHLLITPKIGHAELGEASALDSLELVHFLAALIDG